MERPRVVRGLWLGLAVMLGSCARGDAPADADTRSGAGTAATDADGSWAQELGPVLLVPADSENLAVVVFPRTLETLQSTRLVLLDAAGDTVSPTVRADATDSLRCGDASVVRLGSATPAAWSVGLRSVIKPLRVDSIASPADSAPLVAALARLASAVGSQNASRLRGLHFVLLSARRVRLGERELVVAQLVRRLSQEADPREERTLVIAERGARDTAFVLAHGARSEGTEDTADHFDLLLAIDAPAATYLLVTRERVSGTTYELLERASSGQWRVRWSRAIDC